MTLRSDLVALLPLRWSRTEVPDVEIAAKLMTGTWLARYMRVYAGATSITVVDTHEKLLSWQTWEDGYGATPGELARAYLRLTFETCSRLMVSPSNLGFLAQAPIYANPVRHRTLAYVDVHSAYWQLARVYAPDAMPLERTTLDGTGSWWRPDEVEGTRRLRHAVLGAMWANRVEWCAQGRWRAASSTAPWSNPYLKARIMHTLHAVCLSALDRFTVHAWLTDAAIIDARQAEEMVGWLAETWHLRSRVVDMGGGAVWNAVTYAVGDKRSLNVVHGRLPTRAEPFSNLHPPLEGVMWLQDERRSRSRPLSGRSTGRAQPANATSRFCTGLRDIRSSGVSDASAIRTSQDRRTGSGSPARSTISSGQSTREDGG